MLADIVERIVIDAPQERVWTVVTTAELVAEWLGCIGFKPVLGTTFYMQPDPGKRAAGDISGATHCELLDIDEPVLLRFSWFVPDTPKTFVTITLTAETGERTEVELTHSGWEQFDDHQIAGLRDMLAGGWKSHVLPGLKRVAEQA